MYIAQAIDNWPEELSGYLETPPWEIVSQLADILPPLIAKLPADTFDIKDDVAIHRTAVIEHGCVIKGPAIIGAHSFIATGAYIRGGVWLGDRCGIGPGCEIKTTIMLSESKVAHFNFVGDSILGEGVNMEAGSIIANYRNESPDEPISILIGGKTVQIGVAKFGALVGDRAKIGANAVIAPGAILDADTIVPRLGLVDQRGSGQ